jgi:MGT family glycosyltransferase
MRLGMVCPDLTGHLNPAGSLAQELVRRGHSVSLVGLRTMAPRAAARGLGFVPLGTDAEGEEVASLWRRLGECRGFAALRITGQTLRETAEVTLRDLPAAARLAGLDGLIVDQVCPAAAVVADEQGLPYVVACNALALHIEPAVPPCPLPWRYREGWLWRVRNRLSVRVLRLVFERLAGSVTASGVSPLLLAEEHHRGLAQLAQQPPLFDFPRSRLPDHFHYTGPWHAPGRDADEPFPWEWLDGRPLVYASLGTLQNKLRHVYQAIADAAAGLDVQLVLALGDRAPAFQVTAPPNVLVVGYAPQLPLLDRSAAAVTHAGLNTALECLVRGVPMVCVPITNDQPGVASRAVWLGLGEMVLPQRATAARLRGALARVLSHSGYRRAAERCRRELAGCRGVDRAAEIIEEALGTRCRVLSNGSARRAAGVSPLGAP